MQFIRYSKIWILAFFLGACSLMPSELEVADKLMNTNPDSALKVLVEIKNTESFTDKNRALYGLLLFRALDMNKLSPGPDSIISFSINYFQNNPGKEQLSDCYFYKARMLKMMQRHEEATVLYLKVLDFQKDKENYVLLGELNADMGDICSYQKDFKHAREKYTLSKEFFERAHLVTKVSERLLDIGRTYHFSKKFATALSYYRKALSQSTDSILCGMALQEIGINYYWDLKRDSALFYLEKSLQYPYLSTSKAIRLFTIADIKFDLRDYVGACFYAHESLKFPANYFTRRDCYRILANSECMQKNFQKMAEYMTSYQEYNDSTRIVEVQTKSTVLEDLHSTTQAANKSRHYAFYLIITILVIVLCAWWIFTRIRKFNIKKQSELEHKIDETQSQLIQNKCLLKNNLLKKIEDARLTNQQEYKAANLKKRNEMTADLYKNCLYINDWNQFSELMNSTLNNLIDKLSKRYPELTRKELLWCGLFALGIQNNDIAIILECKAESLYKLKQRITLKMKLASTKELDSLIATTIQL